MPATRALLLAALLATSSCAREHSPTLTVDGVLRAIAAGDVAETQQAFDERVRPAVTAESVRSAARRMQGLGDYRTLQGISAMPDNRYDFEAEFERGSMLVQVRLGPSGAITALHLIPNEVETPG